MGQNEKGLMQWEKDFLISITILIIATIIAHIFFYQTAHNINVPMIYTLATFFISRYTKGYGWGIVSSLLSVIFINWRFTFPYFKINFMIDGYPMTFLGILVIAIITNMTTTSSFMSGGRCAPCWRRSTRWRFLIVCAACAAAMCWR